MQRRDWRIGWRLIPAAPGESGCEVNPDATRRERANGDAEPERAVMLRAAMRR